MFCWGVRWGATAAGLAVYSYCFSHTVTNHVICSMTVSELSICNYSACSGTWLVGVACCSSSPLLQLEGESMLPTINSAAMPTSCDVVLVGFRRKKRGELKR